MTVGEGATLNSAMLCDHVVVKDGACVGKNAVLSFRVVVDRNAVVPPNTCLSLVRQGPSGDEGPSDDDLEVPHKVTSPLRGTPGGGTRGAFESSDDGSDGSDFGEEDGPNAGAVQAAAALAADGIPEFSIDFATDVVGPMGAGFVWERAAAEAAAAERLGLAPSLAALKEAQRRHVGGEEEDDDSDVDVTAEDVSENGAEGEGRGASLLKG